MTDQEIIDKYLSLIEEGKKEYSERQKDENTHKVVEAIRKVTDGEFIGEHYSSTLMGWTKNYDEQGRLLNANPNYKDSEITIMNKTYPITRVGWSAYIWMPESGCGYTTCCSECKEKFLFSKVDLRPDYVKTYQEQKEKSKPTNTKERIFQYEVVQFGNERRLAKIEYENGVKGCTTYIWTPFEIN